eukprot:2944692-Heterocapsa_arctica.AAC.1
MTPDGRQRARTVRRLEPALRADHALMRGAEGTPWNPRTGIVRGRPAEGPQVPGSADPAPLGAASGSSPALEPGVEAAAAPTPASSPDGGMDISQRGPLDPANHERPDTPPGSRGKRARVGMVRALSIDETAEHVWTEGDLMAPDDYVM